VNFSIAWHVGDAWILLLKMMSVRVALSYKPSQKRIGYFDSPGTARNVEFKQAD
jgi:hypothetical protein